MIRKSVESDRLEIVKTFHIGIKEFDDLAEECEVLVEDNGKMIVNVCFYKPVIGNKYNIVKSFGSADNFISYIVSP